MRTGFIAKKHYLRTTSKVAVILPAVTTASPAALNVAAGTVTAGNVTADESSGGGNSSLISAGTGGSIRGITGAVAGAVEGLGPGNMDKTKAVMDHYKTFLEDSDLSSFSLTCSLHGV